MTGVTMQEVDNYDDILSSTSPKFIGRLKVILQELKRIHISRDSSGRAVLDSTVLDDSNFVDLIRYLLYKRRVPPGWHHILDYLKANNFPTSLLAIEENNVKIKKKVWL